MKDLLCDQFQSAVDDVLIRNRSILDIITKLQESTALTNRAVIKTVTTCGCLTLAAHKTPYPDEVTFDQLKEINDAHLKGTLCPACQEVLEKEMGNHLFYLAALCNRMDLNLYDAMIKEYNTITTLGKFGMY